MRLVYKPKSTQQTFYYRALSLAVSNIYLQAYGNIFSSASVWTKSCTGMKKKPFHAVVNFTCERKTIPRHFAEAVLRRCGSENIQQIYRRTPMPKCREWYGCSPGNLMDIFRTPFPKNTPEGLLLALKFQTGVNVAANTCKHPLSVL